MAHQIRLVGNMRRLNLFCLTPKVTGLLEKTACRVVRSKRPGPTRDDSRNCERLVEKCLNVTQGLGGKECLNTSITGNVHSAALIA